MRKQGILKDVDGTVDMKDVFAGNCKHSRSIDHMSVTIKSAKEIELMREAGRLLEIVHKELEEAIRPGISTWELDQSGRED